MPRNHDSIVQSQFGARAADYVASAVHANGSDLLRIAALAAAHRPVHALDLGCGGGHVAYAIAAHCAGVTACDLSGDMLAAVEAEAARRGIGNLATCRASAEALPFADASFDFLACRFSTHHWRNAAPGIAEARRVLRPGAVGVFCDVVAPTLAAADTHLQAVEVLRDPSHGRDYSRAEWLAMLDAAGFAVEAVSEGRLRMDFAEWTGRMRTPADRIGAIRALQALAGDEVASHFAIEADGSFTIDTLLVEVR